MLDSPWHRFTMWIRERQVRTVLIGQQLHFWSIFSPSICLLVMFAVHFVMSFLQYTLSCFQSILFYSIISPFCSCPLSVHFVLFHYQSILFHIIMPIPLYGQCVLLHYQSILFHSIINLISFPLSVHSVLFHYQSILFHSIISPFCSIPLSVHSVPFHHQSILSHSIICPFCPIHYQSILSIPFSVHSVLFHFQSKLSRSIISPFCPIPFSVHSVPFQFQSILPIPLLVHSVLFHYQSIFPYSITSHPYSVIPVYPWLVLLCFLPDTVKEIRLLCCFMRLALVFYASELYVTTLHFLFFSFMCHFAIPDFSLVLLCLVCGGGQ